jgi:hypothetical protein
MAGFKKKSTRRPITTGIRSTSEYYASDSGSAISRGMRGSRSAGIPLPKSTSTLTSADVAYYREGKPASEKQGKAKAAATMVEITIRDQKELQAAVEQVIGLIRQGKKVRITAPAEGHTEITTALRNAARRAGALSKFKVQLVAPTAVNAVPDFVAVTDSPPDLPDAERNLPKSSVTAPLASEAADGVDSPPVSELEQDRGFLPVTNSDETIGSAAIAAYTGKPIKSAGNEDDKVFDQAGTVNVTETPDAAPPLSDEDRDAMSPVSESTGKKRRRRFSTPVEET